MVDCSAKKMTVKLCLCLEAILFEWQDGNALKGLKTKFIPLETF